MPPSAQLPAVTQLAEASLQSIGHVADAVPRHALLEPALPDPNWWAHPEGEAINGTSGVRAPTVLSRKALAHRGGKVTSSACSTTRRSTLLSK